MLPVANWAVISGFDIASLKENIRISWTNKTECSGTVLSHIVNIYSVLMSIGRDNKNSR